MFKHIIGFFLVLIIALFGLIFYFSPLMHKLPKPSGIYAVGTAYYHLKDPTRRETHSADPNSTRELLVQVWYPAQKNSDAVPAPYLSPEAQTVIQHDLQQKFKLPIPSFITHRFFELPTASLLNVPGARDVPFPVIIFPGALPNLYTALLQDLASHGYVVVAINHSIIPRADGTAAVLTLTDIIHDDTKSAEEVDIWIADNAFVLKELTKLNDTDPVLKGMLDLQNIGMLGHSFGGAVALKSCYQTTQCKGAINLDGSFFGGAPEPFGKPALILLQDYRRDAFFKQRFPGKAVTEQDKQAYLNNKFSTYINFCKTCKPGYLGLIEGAGHDAFSDVIFLKSPLAQLLGNDVGETDPYDVFTKVAQYVVGFFDTYLKGRSSEVIEQLKGCTIKSPG